MNPDHTPKTRSVLRAVQVRIACQEVGVTRHYQASWVSQLVGCLLDLCGVIRGWSTSVCRARLDPAETFKVSTPRHFLNSYPISILRSTNRQNRKRSILKTMAVSSLPSASQHPSYGDCLEVKREYYQNSSVLDCVTQCSQSAAHLCEQFLQVKQIGFVTLGPLRCA